MRIPTAEIVVNGRRKIVNADDPRVKDYAEGQGVRSQGRQEEMTRTDIARMKRGEVLDLLAAHGITEAECEGVKLPELKARLSGIMFVDL